ncbi:MAG: hypothetical protein Q4C05_05415 [Akkermansia sp.]|nr:hypothetical protein [Akkermansia sp.]
MLKNLLITITAILIFGIIRLPLQQHLIEEETKAQLLTEQMNLNADEMLEQQLSVISLGGLRPLIAAILSMDAFDCFMRSDWHQLEKRYNQITALAPHSNFYWDNGSWHLAYNAASAMLDNTNLTPMERHEGFKKYIQTGRKFLIDGIRYNPTNWFLYNKLGDLYSDTYRLPDFQKAAQAYHQACKLGASYRVARKEFYSLARVPSKAAEAYELGKKLYAVKAYRTPSMINILFALENRLNLPESQRIPFHELYPTAEEAREMLSAHLQNTLHYPIDGVRKKLDSLPRPATQQP